jgi:hypothetical protein
MYRKQLVFLAVAASILVLAATAAATPPRTAALVIQHVTVGCHSWSLNGGKLAVAQTVSLARGGSLTISDNDVMPHTLVQLAGPAVTVTRVATPMSSVMGLKGSVPPATLAHVGAELKVTFAKPGTYRFTTKAGEDYMKGIKTIGPDHVLKLTVTVS